jgi:hypothetical protein
MSRHGERLQFALGVTARCPATGECYRLTEAGVEYVGHD